MKFTIEKISNMVYITSDCGVIFKAWEIGEFTERKLQNAIKKISGNTTSECEFIKIF